MSQSYAGVMSFGLWNLLRQVPSLDEEIKEGFLEENQTEETKE